MLSMRRNRKTEVKEDLSSALRSASRQAVERGEFRTRPELLLDLGIPGPMSGTAPRVVLGQAWWDKTRQEAYASTGYRCLACGVSKWEDVEHKWLEGHEVYKIDWRRGRMIYVETVPLCHYCHCFIHQGRLGELAKRKEVPLWKLKAVLRHGLSILKGAKLSWPPDPPPSAAVGWERWRLVVEGKEYPPHYKTPDDFRKAFSIGEDE